jgi:Cu2+-exporting ATPase
MTEFDESLLSGESRPVAKKAGDFIAGGSLNLGQPLSVRVSSVGGDTVASRIGQLTEKALAARPRMADVADKVARWISPLTLLTAILASVFWLAVDPSRSFSVAVAILAVTCPCALALAVPAAHALATTRLAREGLLFTRAGALDRLAEIDTLLFDKTGTLTRADISIDAVHELGSLPRNEILVIASSIEAGSAHPIARAIDLLAKSGEGIDESYPHATQLRYFGGAGVEGEIGGIVYRLGHEQFVRELTGATAHIADIASTIYLGRKGEWLAGFDLSDAPKNDAQTTIARLRKQRLNLYVVSGDQQDRVDATAVALNIKPECAKGQLDPDGKLKFAKALTDQGAIVGAIGDGVNDAPLLGAAQVSIAMGSGASLASMTGDAVLMSASLAPVADAVAVAKKMKQIIRQNFVWGIAYNIIAVPLAVAGLVSPAWAAIGMASSSLIVVANSLRLTRINGRSI